MTIRALAWLGGVAAVVAAAAAFAPAALVAAHVAERTRGEVLLADAQGSLWNGRALAGLRGARAFVPVAWQVAPAPLARGEAQVALPASGPGPGVRGIVVLRDDALVARDVEATLPIEALRLPPGVTAGGELRVVAQAASFAPGRHAGAVRLAWSRARLAWPGAPALDLGQVTATLTADGARWRGPVQVRGGSVDAEGEANVDAQGAEIALTLAPGAGFPEALRQALGPADAQGRHALRLAPRFR